MIVIGGSAGAFEAMKTIIKALHPTEAEVRSMPDHAVGKVQGDHCIEVSKMAGLPTRLCQEKIPGWRKINFSPV